MRCCSAPPAAHRWLIGVAGPLPLALAFDRVDGYLRVPGQAVTAPASPGAPGGERRQQHLRDVVSAERLVRPIVNLLSLVAELRQRAPQIARGRSDR